MDVGLGYLKDKFRSLRAKRKRQSNELIDYSSMAPGHRILGGHGVGWKPSGNEQLGYNKSDGYFYYRDGNTINRKWVVMGNNGVYTSYDGTVFDGGNVTFGYSGIVKNWSTGEVDNRQTSLSMAQRAANRQDDRNTAATLLNVASTAISLTPAGVLGDVAEAVEAIEAVSVADRAMQAHNDIQAAELVGHQSAFGISDAEFVSSDINFDTVDDLFGHTDDLYGGVQPEIENAYVSADMNATDVADAGTRSLAGQASDALENAATTVYNAAKPIVDDIANNKVFYATTTGIGVGGMAASNALADNGNNEKAIQDTVKLAKGTGQLLYDNNPVTAMVAGTQLVTDMIRNKKEQTNGGSPKKDQPTVSTNSISETTITHSSHTETDDHRQAPGWHADVRFDREGFERRYQF